tara:strand:+ start:282 stop:458 length:177 start_codon:yes stop_codon:yes gene_type:complete
MEIIITKKFKKDYDNNPFKPKPMRKFGGRPNMEQAIKNKELKSYINMKKTGKWNLDFS